MYDPAAIQTVVSWLPTIGVIGIALIAGLLWSVLR